MGLVKCKCCCRDLPKNEAIHINVEGADNITLCTECFAERTYTNEFQVKFLKFNGKLYMTHGYSNCYKLANEQLIEDAFNPDRARFNKWIVEKEGK